MADTQETISDEQQVWDTAKYEAALAHFEKLQEQIDALRCAITGVVTPLMHKSPSKEQLFADVKYGAETAAADLKDFRDNWQSEQTQSLLAKATESKQKDGDLSKGATVRRYGWLSRN